MCCYTKARADKFWQRCHTHLTSSRLPFKAAMPGKRSAEAQKRRSEKAAPYVYASLQRRETTVAIREVAAARREVMAPQVNDASMALAQAALCPRWSTRCAFVAATQEAQEGASPRLKPTPYHTLPPLIHLT